MPCSSRCSTFPVRIDHSKPYLLEELVLLSLILCKHSRRQSKLRLVRLLQRLVQRRDLVNSHQWYKQLLLQQTVIRRKTIHNSRRNIVALRKRHLRNLPTNQNLPILPGLLNSPLILPERSLINHRPHKRRLQPRITDHRNLLNLRFEQLQEILAHTTLNIDPRRRTALLTIIAKRRPNHSLCRLVEIRFRSHDRRILTAHLGNERLRIRLLHNKIPVELHANIPRTSKRNSSHHRITGKFSPERAPGTSNVVDDARRNTSLDKSLIQFQSSERSLTRRLEDHRITRNQSASDHRRR